MTVYILGEDGFIAESLRTQGSPVHVLGGSTSRTRLVTHLSSILARGRFDLFHCSAGGRLPRHLARLAGCVVLSHIHGPIESWAQAFERGEVPAREVRRAFISGADLVAACSRSVSAAFEPYCHGIAPMIISPGVDSRQPMPCPEYVARVRKHFCIGEHDFVAAFAGRLVAQKGVAYLIQAAQRLRRCPIPPMFLIIGDGPLRRSLEASAESALPGRFRFVGEQQDVPGILAASDVTVVPSEWEPFGIVNLEAMSVARPVIAFSVGGISEIVRHGETGLLVPHRDVAALAQAIEQIAALPDRGATMGLAGRRLVHKCWDIRDIARRVEHIYGDMAHQ